MAVATVNAAGGAPHIAIIGAGVAGLACAQCLRARGFAVTVFERRDTVGGRLVGMQTEEGYCDAGAQFLNLQNPAFAQHVREWVGADLLRTWAAQLVELRDGQVIALGPSVGRYIGVPSMARIAEHMARDLDIVFSAEVVRIERIEGKWRLFGWAGRTMTLEGFDAVVLALPSNDALGLARELTPLAARLEPLRWDACWSASLALSRPSGIEFDGAFISDDPILAWASRENSKPLRVMGEGTAERWVLQARSSWSNNFPGLLPDEAARWMQRAFAARISRPMAQKSCVAMRWINATPADVLGEAYLWDPRAGVGFVGDWCGGARIESAILSGTALGRNVAF